MKTHRLLTAVGLLGFVALTPAQNYAIDWFTIDGGGGTSSGGAYSLTGTIGQADAGTSSGGSYTLQGGFWGGAFAVQQVGAPTLQVENLGLGGVRISWQPTSPGFVLQETGTLATDPVPWLDSPSGATNPMTIPVSGNTRFFRLIKR